jgi:hypothetical protein
MVFGLLSQKLTKWICLIDERLMSTDSTDQDLLWSVLLLVRAEGNFKLVIDKLIDFYGSGGDFPSDIDEPLTTFLSSGDSSDLMAVAIACAKEMIFDPVRQARLVAYLFAQSKIKADCALECLNFHGAKTDDLPPRVRSLVDAVWLLREDREFDRAGADDELFSERLLALAEEGLEPESD